MKKQQSQTKMEYEMMMRAKEMTETVNQSMRKIEEMEAVRNQIKDYDRRKRSIEMHKKKINDRSDYIEEYF